METPAAAAPAKKGSVFEDLIDIYFSPSEVFERRKDGKFGVALIVFVVLTAVLTALAYGYLDAAREGDFMRGIAAARAKNPGMTDEQLAMGRNISEKFQLYGTPIIMLVLVFLVGITLWLVGKIFGSTQTLGLAVMVATYSQYPRLIQWVLNGIQGYLMDPAKLTSMFRISMSPARFMDPATTPMSMLVLLSRLDIFTIWCTILLGLGLHITGNVPKGKAFAAAAIVWLIGTLPVLLPALAQG